jgi:hypothetical protein
MPGVGVLSLSWRMPVSLPSARSTPIADWPLAAGSIEAVHAVAALPSIASFGSAWSAPVRLYGL